MAAITLCKMLLSGFPFPHSLSLSLSLSLLALTLSHSLSSEIRERILRKTKQYPCINISTCQHSFNSCLFTNVDASTAL